MSARSTAYPEKLHSYKAYNEGERLIGIKAEVELPSLEAMTSTVSGPGFLGEADTPNVGYFGSMSTDIAFNTMSEQAAALMEPGPHLLTFRGDQQSYDSAGGKICHRALKVVLRGFTKAAAIGTFNAGNPTETSVTLEIFYIKIELDDFVILELDKYNEIYVVNNKDMLAEVRANT